MLKRALIVGASSGIGAQLARVLANQGHHVGLVARRQEQLDALATELRAAHPDRVFAVRAHDVRNPGEAAGLFAELTEELGGMDLVVYAAGVMPAVEPDEFDTEKDRAMVEVNLTGAIAWLNPAAQRFSDLKEGTIVGLGSVAGDRGRRGSPVYCASKAALSTYLESLRNRLSQHGVQVLTIKPGPVATPMTEGLGKLPMLIPVEQAADSIWAAIASGNDTTAYVPGQWKPIMLAIRHVPSLLFRRLNI